MDRRKKGGVGDEAAIHEMAAKKLNRAADACRVQKGGLECLKLDVEAAVVRNAPAIADALLRDAGGGLGALRERALAATVEMDAEPPPRGPAISAEKGAAPSAPASVSGAVEVEETPVLNAIAEPAPAPAAKMEEPCDDRS